MELCDKCGRRLPYGLKYTVSIQSKLPLYKQNFYTLCPGCADYIYRKLQKERDSE